VQSEVITASKAPLTNDALEWFGSGVFAIVTRQFVGSGKPPFALWPLTCVRLFTWKIKRKSNYCLKLVDINRTTISINDIANQILSSRIDCQTELG
jgi:hypothetical protein